MILAAFIASWLAVAGVLVGWYLDQRRHEAMLRDLLDRISTSPRVVIRPGVPVADVAADPPYVSDLPYHDELWDDFVAANEAPLAPEEPEDE